MNLRLHGDVLATASTLDFAVNVQPGPRPAALEAALRDALARDGYPDEREARVAVATRHERDPDEVLLLNGACEAFWLLAHALRPRRAVCVQPSFTEPEAALLAVGTSVAHVFRDPDSWALPACEVPADVELVVLGNPNNPTGTLDSAEVIARLARPGRVLVVDESFSEFVPGERESLASRRDVPGLVVVRSLTKLWSLAGIRAGYLLAEPELVRRLEANRQPWSVNALACTALAVCAHDRETPARVAAEVESARARLVAQLQPLVERVWPSEANFLLLEVDDGERIVATLLERGIAVRPCASFPGLTSNHIRVAVRGDDDNDRLVEALA
jgi:histidinol-phosphate aminotransferase